MHHNSDPAKIAVVIPAYNEAATIRQVVERTLLSFETVIIVDDGSVDETSTQLQGLPVYLVRHQQNMGKAASLRDGFQLALFLGADSIISLDGDGQHAPEDIPLLLETSARYPHDIIIGARLADKKEIPLVRYIANRFANFWIAWAAGYRLVDSQSGFRLYPAKLFTRLPLSTNKWSSFVYESEILIKAARRGIYSQAVKVTTLYPENARPSHYRGARDTLLITFMVARQLLSRGLYPQGLWRSLFGKRQRT